MNQNPSVRFIFGIVLLSVLTALIIGSIIGAFDKSLMTNSSPSLITYIAMFVGQSLLILPVLIFLVKNKLNFSDSFRLNLVSYKVIFATFFISFGAIILSNEINILVGMIIPIPDSFLQLELMLKPEDPLSLILLIITIVIVAPIGEELLFRGYLQKNLENLWKDVTRAILFSSLFFAIIHFNPFWIIQIYFLGVLLGYLAWKTNSIIPCIIFHIIINGTSLLFTSIEEKIESIILWNGHINPLLLIICGLLFWHGLAQLKHERVN